MLRRRGMCGPFSPSRGIARWSVEVRAYGCGPTELIAAGGPTHPWGPVTSSSCVAVVGVVGRRSVAGVVVHPVGEGVPAEVGVSGGQGRLEGQIGEGADALGPQRRGGLRLHLIESRAGRQLQ